MSTCDCKSKVEAQLVERLKDKHPDATGHKAQLEGYGLAVVYNTAVMMPCMPIKGGAFHDNKKTGEAQWKKSKGVMAFTFCPFCGTRIKP